MTSEEAAYIAGLFDGEGSINIKRGIEKKKKHKNKLGYRLSNSMRISMEITMTDKSVLIWVHEVLGVGTLKPKTVRGTRKDGTPYLKQYKWRCVFRDAYLVSCALFPYAHVKLDKIQKVIDYYASRDLKVFNNKVVSLDEYKESMNLE
jgi:hypothetical protein|tara:strand:- start:41 stop:484 length:444 start_codon:yes stop_codon:yes gene_type:complete